MTEKGNREWPFRFKEELVLRTPALPFTSMPDETSIEELIQDENFLEAVYLASPVLYAECMRWKNRTVTDTKEIQKIKSSLVKYYQRMYSRCTPFGLFAGCSLVKWQPGEPGIVLPRNHFLRSTRLDMHFLCAAAQHLSAIPSIKQRLRFFPNNSGYRMGDEVRYIEYRYLKGKRIHQISSVQYSHYINAVLNTAVRGATIGEMAALLITQEQVTEEEAVEFIEEMVSSQVLISEMDPAITGDEFIHQLLAILNKINVPAVPEITGIKKRFEVVLEALNEIDTRFHNSPTVYASLIEVIQSMDIAFEENKLFQTDMYSRPVKNGINENAKADLQKAITVLAALQPFKENDNLVSFADRFRKRYEDQAVPLLQVLDTETGIGYIERSGNNLSPLLENLIMPGQQEADTYDIKWNKREEWLFNLLIKNSKAHEVVIEENDLGGLEADFSHFPPSLSVLFAKAEEDTIILKGCSGSSAANLLGRFAHADQQIKDLVLAITKEEQQLNRDVVFAEIVHLPEDRVGNILLHPAFHRYEIPFLARSSQSPEHQVLLQEILVRVGQDKQVRLFSKKLDKEIIPRLSNAHNYSAASLPVYHFLADMQTQGLTEGIAFNWGRMSQNFSYLPRVRSGPVILFEATWQLKKEHFASLLSTNSFSPAIATAFQQQWELPRLFVLADGDNEMLVDWESPASVNTFLRTIKGREAIVLKEYSPPCPTTVTDENNKRYNNQFVAILINNRQVYTGSQPVVLSTEEMAGSERKFMPGSEWVYYKIYCGSKTADEILQNCIYPLSEKLLAASWIDKWFYIRYNDPDFHLRVRFHCSSLPHLDKVLEFFLLYIREMDAKGLVWKLQLDSYQREMERYGHTLVEQAEQLFFTDSKMKMQFLSLTEGDDREKFRWLWGLRGVDELLSAFEYTLEHKYAVLQTIQEVFAKEFNAGKSFYRQLNQQYNDNRAMIQLAMENPVQPGNYLAPLLNIYDVFKNEMRNTARAIIQQVGGTDNHAVLDNLLGSYIHMDLNRLFLSEPRQHELVMYDFLCSHYRSLLKRKEGTNPGR
jgi:lantibiotic biosynthesis protein